LLKKDVLFHWSYHEQQAFDALKEKHLHAPDLALPDFSVPFMVETDTNVVSVLCSCRRDTQSPSSAKLWGQRQRLCQPKRKNVWLYCLLSINGGPICNTPCLPS
jgi:hypothetical protein